MDNEIKPTESDNKTNDTSLSIENNHTNVVDSILNKIPNLPKETQGEVFGKFLDLYNEERQRQHDSEEREKDRLQQEKKEQLDREERAQIRLDESKARDEEREFSSEENEKNRIHEKETANQAQANEQKLEKIKIRGKIWFYITRIILPVCIILIVSIIFFKTFTWAPGKSSSFEKMNFEECQSCFTLKGFEDVKCIPIFENDKKSHDSLVADVSIGGSKKFNTYLPHLKKTPVVINYYAYRKTYMPFTEEDCIGCDYLHVETILRNSGFTNVNESLITNTEILGFDNNKVVNITVNGQNNFSTKSIVSLDSEIVVTYYCKDKKYMPFSADTFKGKNYKDVKNILETAGFSNILMDIVYDATIINNGSVFSVNVNGLTDFKERDTFPGDAPIIVAYHEKPENRPAPEGNIYVPENSNKLQSKDFAEVYNEFQEAGFSTIVLDPIYDLNNDGKRFVETVVIGSVSDFKTTEFYPFDTVVTIKYHDYKSEKPQNEGMVVVGESISSLVGKNYSEVFKIFKDKGFLNVKLEPIDAKRILILNLPSIDISNKKIITINEVKKITVNGEDYDESASYLLSSEIIIYYLSKPES